MRVLFEDLPTMDYDVATALPTPAFLDACRRDTPLLRLTSPDPERNVLLVTAPADVLQVIADADTFSSTDHPQSRRYDSDFDPKAACIYASAGRTLKNVLVWSDGAYHARVRKLVNTAFSPKRVEAKIPHIQAFIDQLVDRFADGGDIEFIDAFAWWLPTMVVTREFGLRAEDVDLVMETTNRVAAMLDPLGDERAAVEAAPLVTRLQALLLERLATPGSLPEHALLADLASAEAEGEPALSSEELMWLASLILIAGSHTTGAMLGWSAYMLATRPDVQQALRDDPSGIDAFVEETLRIHGPVPTSYRTTVRDTQIGGVSVPSGTWVVVRWDSVNQDDERFPDAAAFCPSRGNVRRHSTFGHGKHFCIGNMLARCELKLTVATLLRRFSNIALACEPDAVTPIKSFDTHILAALPLRLTP